MVTVGESGKAEGSDRPIAFDRDPTSGARLRVVVPDRLMLDAAVVPKGDRMRLPAEPNLEFLRRAELAQIVEDRPALVPRQPVDMGGEFAVDVQRLSLRDRMGANDRMRCLGINLAAFWNAHQGIVPAV